MEGKNTRLGHMHANRTSTCLLHAYGLLPLAQNIRAHIILRYGASEA